VLLDTHVFLWWQRLLAAQALDEFRGVVSADPVFGKYGVKRIW
jgi:PIN domain nuclease of toxin-antitoxin system